MSKPYRTYLLGKGAFFDGRTAIGEWTTHANLNAPYESIWRILHIDGFEPMHRCFGCWVENKIHFKMSAVPARPCHYCGKLRDEKHDQLACSRNLTAQVDAHLVLGRPYGPMPEVKS